MIDTQILSPYFVAPLVGAWIEMSIGSEGFTSVEKSLLSWERGLKSQPGEVFKAIDGVAPLVGAWIEIVFYYQ